MTRKLNAIKTLVAASLLSAFSLSIQASPDKSLTEILDAQPDKVKASL